MRTESNTVLPLSSSVPNKGTKIAQASADNGAAFGRDFNKAKADLDPRKTNVSGAFQGASESESKPSLTSKSEDTKVHKANSVSGVDETPLPSKNSSETSSISVSSSESSGKVLQSNGDLSPVSNVDVELIEDGVSLSPTDSLDTVALLSTTTDSGENLDEKKVLTKNPEMDTDNLINLEEAALPVVSQAVVSATDDSSVQFEGVKDATKGSLKSASAMLVGSEKMSQAELTSDVVDNDGIQAVSSSDSLQLQPNVNPDVVRSSSLVGTDAYALRRMQ